MNISVRTNISLADRMPNRALLEQRLSTGSRSTEAADGLRSTMTGAASRANGAAVQPSDGFQRIGSEIKDAEVGPADDPARPTIVPYMQNMLYGASSMSAYMSRGMRLDALA